jgi:serine O-acetyltransferase
MVAGRRQIEVPPCRHDLAFTVRCLRSDWRVNQGAIGRLVIVIYRFGHLLDAGFLPRRLSRVLWPLYRTLDLVWSKLLAGADISHGTCIGPGLRLGHGGRGVILVTGTVVGANVSFFPFSGCGTTVTRPGVWPLPVPILEDDVAVGRGAAVMGAVHVGKGALIGANSVVLKDVPAGARIGAVTRWL